MRFFILFFLLITACSKPQSKLICGDHECVNKLEAKQYFEENLTLEVRIIDKKDRIKSYDLVQYNLKKTDLRFLLRAFLRQIDRPSCLLQLTLAFCRLQQGNQMLKI